MPPDLTPVPCPSCGSTSHSHKLSLVYLQASARLSRGKQEGPSDRDAALSDLLAHFDHGESPRELDRLLRRLERAFAPPVPPAKGVPPVHPDWMVFFGAACGLAFAALIFFQNQRSGEAGSAAGALPVIFSLLAVMLLTYVLTRQPVLSRYVERLRAGQEAQRQHALAAGRWLRLYVCSLEPVVFDPLLQTVRPINQVRELLYSEPEHP